MSPSILSRILVRRRNRHVGTVEPNLGCLLTGPQATHASVKTARSSRGATRHKKSHNRGEKRRKGAGGVEQREREMQRTSPIASQAHNRRPEATPAASHGQQSTRPSNRPSTHPARSHLSTTATARPALHMNSAARVFSCAQPEARERQENMKGGRRRHGGRESPPPATPRAARRGPRLQAGLSPAAARQRDSKAG